MEGKKQIPEFLRKMYDMVNDQYTDDIVSWSRSGTSFMIWRSDEFAEHILPLFFNHNNFFSFSRQLNKYGFTKMERYSCRYEFAQQNFVRGQPELLQNIGRRPKTFKMPSTEARELREEAEKLRREKRMLQFKIETLEAENQSYEGELRHLKMNPENSSSERALESERNNKKRRCPETDNLLKKTTNISNDIY